MSIETNVVPLFRSRATNCAECGRGQICFGAYLHDVPPETLESVDVTTQLIHRGDHVFFSGQEFAALYVVRSGNVKTTMVSEDGEEQIIGFHGAGDMLGADGIAHGNYALDAVALDTGSVCAISFERLLKSGAGAADVQRLIVSLFSEIILRGERMLLTLGKLDARQRLAAFLLMQSRAQKRRGFSPTAFTLSMSRADIGNHLNLAVETVSRLLTRFRKEGLIKLERNDVRDLDLERLRAMSGDPANGRRRAAQ